MQGGGGGWITAEVPIRNKQSLYLRTPRPSVRYSRHRPNRCGSQHIQYIIDIARRFEIVPQWLCINGHDVIWLPTARFYQGQPLHCRSEAEAVLSSQIYPAPWHAEANRDTNKRWGALHCTTLIEI
jgi:hypothetical protein